MPSAWLTMEPALLNLAGLSCPLDRQTLADPFTGRLPTDYDRVLQSRRQVWLQEANPFGLEILYIGSVGWMTGLRRSFPR